MEPRMLVAVLSLLCAIYGISTLSNFETPPNSDETICGANFTAALVEAFGAKNRVVDKFINGTFATECNRLYDQFYREMWRKLLQRNATLAEQTIYKVYRYMLSDCIENRLLFNKCRSEFRDFAFVGTTNFLQRSMYPANYTQFNISVLTEQHMSQLSDEDLTALFNKFYTLHLHEHDAEYFVNRLFIIPLTSRELEIAYKVLSTYDNVRLYTAANYALNENIALDPKRREHAWSHTILAFSRADTLRLRNVLTDAHEQPLYLNIRTRNIGYKRGNGQSLIVHRHLYEYVPLLYPLPGRHFMSFAKVDKNPQAIIKTLSYMAPSGMNLFMQQEVYRWNVSITDAFDTFTIESSDLLKRKFLCLAKDPHESDSYVVQLSRTLEAGCRWIFELGSAYL